VKKKVKRCVKSDRHWDVKGQKYQSIVSIVKSDRQKKVFVNVRDSCEKSEKVDVLYLCVTGCKQRTVDFRLDT
jgi:hypothetical protein